MRKTLAGVLAGLAFVVGGFFAGTSLNSDAAVAQEDTASEAPAEPGRFGPKADHRRGPGGHLLDFAADYLGMERDALIDYIRDGGVIAELEGADCLTAALVTEVSSEIDQAVEDGKLDAERAEEIKDGLEERIDEFVNTVHEPRERPDGPLGDRHVRGFIKEAAEVIGIDVEVLVEGLKDGKSIAEVAEENGTSEGSLVAHLTNAARERIEEAVNKTR